MQICMCVCMYVYIAFIYFKGSFTQYLLCTLSTTTKQEINYYLESNDDWRLRPPNSAVTVNLNDFCRFLLCFCFRKDRHSVLVGLSANWQNQLSAIKAQIRKKSTYINIYR